MFWRRKNDGFEWREHVRTTIKIRREDRARRIDEIKHAAASGAKAAGQHSVTAGRSGLAALWAALAAAAAWAWAALLGAGQWCGVALMSGTQRAGGAIAALASRARGGRWRWNASPGAARRRSRLMERLKATLTRAPHVRFPKMSANTKIALMFGVLGGMAALSALLQYREAGADWPAVLAGLVAIVLLLLSAAPMLRRGLRAAAGVAAGRWAKMPSFNVRRPSGSASAFFAGGRAGSAAAAIAVLVALSAVVWAWQSGGLSATSKSMVAALPTLPTLPPLPSLPAWPEATGSTPSVPTKITGRGRAITGDTIRLNGRIIRLAGIEAPEITQVCRDHRNRAWRCGQRARSVLRRIIRRRTIVCTDTARGNGGRVEATCEAAGSNVGEEVVRKGYAFANGMIFKTFASAESEAREDKRGIWQGVAERPADYRAKRWELASKSAPDGCPIKGRVVRKAKVYVLPWALEYRRVRVSARRGERWFCSEDDAAAAGFRPSATG